MSLKKIVIDFVKEQSKIHGFELQLDTHKMAQLDGEDYSSGFFESPDMGITDVPLLAVGIKKPVVQWAPVLLHEFCHFTQYQEQITVWKDYIRVSSLKPTKLNLKRLHKITMELESDCEKRTIKLIKKLKIEHLIDPIKYAKQSNAYITFYHIFEKTEKWYQNAPFDIDEILELMPSTIKSPSSLKPSYSLVGLYIDKCYNITHGGIK